MINFWDRRWLEMAKTVSQWSKDTSTKVGCVIVDDRNVVLSLGWNGMPRLVDDSILSRYSRPAKYMWFEHAERNAIYNAAAVGHSLSDATLYTTLQPCCECARGLIQAGIKRVVIGNQEPSCTHWDESFEVAYTMFKEAKVKYEFLQKELQKDEKSCKHWFNRRPYIS